MSQLTVSCNPSENEESTSVTEKVTTPSPGTKTTLTAQKNRTVRGSTPGDSASNTTEDAFFANKLQNNFPRRTVMKPLISPSPYKRPASASTSSPVKLETQYNTKKKRYLQLKKDLMDKQKCAQDLYNDMSQLREKVITSGGKDPGKLEDVKVEVGSSKQIPSGETTISREQMDNNLEKLAIGNEFLKTLESKLEGIPKKSQNLCYELLDKQSEFVAFITSHLINASEVGSETDNAMVTVQLEAHQKECDSLRSRLVEIEETETSSMTELMKSVRELVRGCENYRAKLKEMKFMENQKELEIQLHATVEELQLEREKNSQNKERVRDMENKLQKARSKIRELEAHVANDDGKIQQLQTNVKNLETQIKQKDQSMDAKLKEMQRTMKSSKGLVDKVEKQRDTLETRLVELKEKMNSKENDAMTTIKELSEKLNEVTNEVGIERDKRHEMEEAFSELQERYKNLEEKSQQLCELAEKNKDFTIIEGSHTENEVRLYNELEEARKELKDQTQMMRQLQQEKEEIVAVMHQAANHDEEEDSRERLAKELVFKTNELQNLMMQHSELKKVTKNAQERNGILERQLMEIQNRLQSQLKEGGRVGLSAHAIELQQQVSDLSNNLAEVVQQKEELETALTQKQLELEQRDRVMREQSKFLKVRDELLDILKGNVRQENGELSSSDENNEYLQEINAKTEMIQELYETLENKQRQIMRLGKMVKLMEEQQDRAQAQRTRFENRIAQLELIIQRSKEQRGKGFGIL
uniref:putative leucine-rich repeat-containing protein DDB_G0290503 isoform X2 n=1 Tax=Osmia lignaria TaxID=473952 RepID=UPI001478A982|nr:putative leucine-rich repeat-containing protein DDB_G0290503 isoform X2 [Osmia lignaria]